MREHLDAALLLLGAVLIVAGVAQWSHPAGWVTGGVLLAVWTLVAVRDIDDEPAK